MKKLITILLLLTLITLIGCSNEVEEKETIKLGAILPLTGPASDYGVAWEKALALGVEKIEDKYNVEVELILEDSQLESAEAVIAAQKLINVDRVKAIIPGSSGEILAMAPIIEENKVLLIGGGSHPDITYAGDYIFRVYPSDLYQGNDLADFISEQGYEKIAILNILNDYGTGISEVVKDRIVENGGEVVIAESFEVKSTNFKTELNKIKRADPEVLLIIAHHYPTILKEIKELGLDLPLVASETLISISDDESLELAEGISFPYYVDPESPELTEFLEAHDAKFGVEPGYFASGLYDCVVLSLEALLENEGDVEQAKGWLYDLKDWRGASGITNFDENGDTVGKSYSIYVVKDGEFVPIE
ncbi:ABC transporter substrate-binding protein [Candidatus Woesearchaeota archaeon]|jgi:branched-chain amino acid transport system substrate-binding protein|nr:ABC transporter substrate-binding protein [Candidatus Woesearchaeota archaeon]MBT4367993.1 ABC transporter substrate-binding protein [Candidatus Woesearchaeota archaeon]MBT4712481.1 ABC transporter substrate-binding protein [Candidatus Woesearchaeota archaeon]MBT6639394.1 ABC transporter substrate-binding protein [Candidatus Woesearchaeota archaeon]MBT7133566.1 ABC transporter substrate-binding protein [Candidatus Woesearchaeota archaeon]